MSKDVTIFSTLTSSVACAIWAQTDPRQPKKVSKKILIKGGANVADKHVLTPKGVATRISAEDYEILKEHQSFKNYLERGFVSVDFENKKDVEKAVQSMEKKDKSAPKTEKDHKPAENLLTQ